MKYSIIITYRNREKHLEMLLPKLTEIFKDEEYEIIISEQDNNEKFQKNSLYNLAVRKAKGKILVFHDVDYYPAENVSYFTEGDTQGNATQSCIKAGWDKDKSPRQMGAYLKKKFSKDDS